MVLSVKISDLEAKRLLREKESERIKLADEMKENKKLLEEKLSNVDAEIKIKESGYFCCRREYSRGK